MSANTAYHLETRNRRSIEQLLVAAHSKYNQWMMFNSWVHRRQDLLSEIEEFIMSGKKKDRAKAKWSAFVNVDIPHSERDTAKPIIIDYDKTVDRTLEVVALGYKLSLAYQASSDSYIATLTGAYADLPNAGKSMSGYGKHWMVALGSVMYKHFDICAGKWDDDTESGSELFG